MMTKMTMMMAVIMNGMIMMMMTKMTVNTLSC